MSESSLPNPSGVGRGDDLVARDPLPPLDGTGVYPPELLAAASAGGWDESHFITRDPLPPLDGTGVYPPELLAASDEQDRADCPGDGPPANGRQ